MVQEVKFSDAGIGNSYNDIRTAGEDDAGYWAQDDFLKLLSRVADSPDLSAVDAEKKLLDPSVSREEKVRMVRDGMTSEERDDLRKVFFDIQAPLSLEMRSLAADILEIPLQLLPQDAPIEKGWLAVDDNGDVCLGGVDDGCQATVTNLSVAATKGKVEFDLDGSNGRDGCRTLARLVAKDEKDHNKKGVRSGDWLRIHTINFGRTDKSGGPSHWLNVRVNLGKDQDNAVVRSGFFKIEACVQNGVPVEGQFVLSSRSKASRISEPFTQVQFTNKRTGEKSLVTLDEHGRFPAANKDGTPIVLKGNATDTWGIAASDGVNDLEFKNEINTVGVDQWRTQDLPEPVSILEFLNANGTDRCRRKVVNGKLWGKNGPSPDDVYQGSVGDCWLVCSAAALAKWAPDLLKKMIVDNGDGTYTVTLHEYDKATDKYIPLAYTVKADFLFRGSGQLYGQGKMDDDGLPILWWPILEKAFADFFEGYAAIQGNWMSFALETLTGLKPHRQNFSVNQSELAWQKINELTHNPNAIVTTATSTLDAAAEKQGYVGSHAYTVTGCLDDGTTKWVIVRNPWGYFEGNLDANGHPKSNDTVDDGEFPMPLDDFLKYYGELEWVDRAEAA